MTHDSTGNVPPPFVLTDDEAVTLRRIAFGQSELRTLRRADIDRLLKLRLITRGKDSMVLTSSGQRYFESLPRAVFSDKPRQRDGWRK